MGLANRLKDLAVELERKNNSLFAYPVQKQTAYVQHFPEPKDDVQRSYFQYRCQMKFNNPLVSFALNIASFPLFLFYLTKGGTIQTSHRQRSIFFSDGKPENIIPQTLREAAGEIEVISEKKELLTKEDKGFIHAIWKRYPLSFQFLLKCLLKIRYYSYEIQRVHPKNIIVCNEYSFTSSVLTHYCEKHGIRHINVMHGEKLYYMRDSFFRFHECYVWDAYYKSLLLQLRAEKTQFKVAIPPSLVLRSPCAEKTVDYTYYLGAEKGEALKRIVTAMAHLQQKGFSVAIRPHPRYSNIEEIQRSAPNVEVENIKEMCIEASLERTKNAVSVYSTVLNQASWNGIGVVMDDISNPEKYNRLKDIQYIMLTKAHSLLSEILETNQ